jgi:hypothetical protein
MVQNTFQERIALAPSHRRFIGDMLVLRWPHFRFVSSPNNHNTCHDSNNRPASTSFRAIAGENDLSILWFTSRGACTIVGKVDVGITSTVRFRDSRKRLPLVIMS